MKPGIIQQPPPTTTTTRSTNLLKAIKCSYWETALTILRQTDYIPPRKIDYVDGRGMTALHYACLDPSTPHTLIEMLLAACVDAPLVQDKRGDTPLHAISDNSDDMTLKMIERCPPAAFKVNKFGETPLHRAVFRNRSSEVIETLLRVNPAAAMSVNKRGRMPIHEIFGTWDPGLKILMIALSQEGGYASVPVDVILGKLVNAYYCRQKEVKEVYEQTLLLLKAFIWGTLEEGGNEEFLPLHSLLRVGNCPFSFFELFLKLNPEDETLKDEDGNLPLHLSAAARGEDAYNIFCYLLRDNYRLATTPNNNGRTALNIALSEGKYLDIDSLKAIIHSSPHILGTMDQETNLLPFMVAAVGYEEDISNAELRQLNTVYFLLRQSPNFVDWGLSSI